MNTDQLRFIIIDHPEEFDLIEEASFGNDLIADLSRINGVWHVTFFPRHQQLELSWEDFAKVYQSFQAFIEEMKTYPKEQS
ncbi:hypothetical protein [Tengunoibacter tsumagoiensis]|uniref:Uncharacterized protein n=1 Tax=Tengunoibacter tsumagoiensis TaxID=2014871 RepID=A0A402A4R8_9CHLR|nr:hypothetical protein [Tengunoibacter tsumagoiensis]GCE14143.1 hypothetical protein KTT_40020 [Tengunoibacter tsumagoiensis]